MQKNSAYIRSVLKALLVLEQFTNNKSEKGIHELSISTGMPASTIQRIVNTLEFKGYLMQNPNTNKYRLGFTLYNLSRNFAESFTWVEEAKYHLEKLVQKYEETVNLAVLEGQKIVYLTKVDSPHILRPNFDIGVKYPIHCTSLGKCLLAFSPPELIDRIIPSQLQAYTKKTITDPQKLKVELFKIREQGYAIDDEEFQEGLCCIAAPVKDTKGKAIAAISMTAPKVRVTANKLSNAMKDLLDTAANISKELIKMF